MAGKYSPFPPFRRRADIQSFQRYTPYSVVQLIRQFQIIYRLSSSLPTVNLQTSSTLTYTPTSTLRTIYSLLQPKEISASLNSSLPQGHLPANPPLLPIPATVDLLPPVSSAAKPPAILNGPSPTRVSFLPSTSYLFHPQILPISLYFKFQNLILMLVSGACFISLMQVISFHQSV